MAVKKKPAKAPQKSTLPTELVLNLSDPSLCGSLRAGLGGLAAAIRFIGLEDDPKLRWPAEVPIGKGVAVVEPDRILLRWGAEPEEFLTRLFARSFRLRESEGLIDIAGTYEYGDPPSLPVASAIQDAYRLTMLQHGKMATKRGKPALRQWSDGDREITVEVQGYESFIQQSGVSDVLKSLKQPIQLAGWAVSGGAQRHIAFGATKLEYGPVATLAAYFTIAGTLSLAAPGKRGAFVVLEPADLQAFARLRPRLSARRRVDAFVLAAGDALLQVLTMPRMEEKQQMLGSAVRSVEACVLALLPWASQQKSRTRVIRARSIADSVLDQFDKLARQLPNRVRVRKDGGSFDSGSAFRGFVAENLAQGRRWFADFATAKTESLTDPRYIHRYRTEDKDFGALFPEEREGIRLMIEHLEIAEKALVNSVHIALKQRFVQIAKENKENPGPMKNRFRGERDKWRLAFAGAKTHDQIRAALADLWSRGGHNAELADQWQAVLPLLRAEHWQTARDLALVALASYRSARTEETDVENELEPSEDREKGNRHDETHIWGDRDTTRSCGEQPEADRRPHHDATEAHLERRSTHDGLSRIHSICAEAAPC